MEIKDIRQVLKANFGYDTFRPMQEEIIQHTINGGDSLVLMPTGGGKSLCFQMATLMMEGMAVVVSPLISLMKDQVGSLRANGIAAEALNSSNDEGLNRNILERCIAGQVKLIVSPVGVMIFVKNIHNWGSYGGCSLRFPSWLLPLLLTR